MANFIIRRKISVFELGESVVVKPDEHLAVRAHMNLKLELYSPFKLTLENLVVDEGLYKKDFLICAEPLFCKENFISENKGNYIFQTKYSKSLDDVLKLKDTYTIPYSIKALYTREPYKNLEGIAYDIKGNRENCVEILQEFHKFAREKVRKKKTSGKSIKSIVKELKKNDYYHGNCKEVSLLIVKMANCLGLPARQIMGKYTADAGGHMWPEVCVPYRNSYIWVPVDASMNHFNKYTGDHIYFCTTPSDGRNFIQRLQDKFFTEDNASELKITHV